MLCLLSFLGSAIPADSKLMEAPVSPMSTPTLPKRRAKPQPPHAFALVSALESGKTATVLATARLRRQLSQEQAAKRSGITIEQVRWLEEGRVYAFRSPDDALAAAVMLASALEISNREARELAGLPVLPRSLQRNPRGRLGLIAALIVLAIAGAITLGYALHGPASNVLPFQNHGPKLPPTYRIKVAVQNGSGDLNYTRLVANRIAALGYAITSVERARTFTYKHTTIFYTDSGKGRAIAKRLADSLGVPLLPLPNGKSPNKLLAIIGPRNLGRN